MSGSKKYNSNKVIYYSTYTDDVVESSNQNYRLKSGYRWINNNVFHKAGSHITCSDDDDNDTPTPTPPEVNLAKEIEGLYNAHLFLTYESAQDTSDQTINFFPQGKDYVKLKTSNINYKIGKNMIGSIEIDSIPVANSFSKAADHNIYFKITNKKVTLSKLGEMTANGNGSIRRSLSWLKSMPFTANMP